MAENVQLTVHTKFDELRKELTPKIDEKVSQTVFWTVIGFFVLFIVGICTCIMNMSERITRMGAIIKMIKLLIIILGINFLVKVIIYILAFLCLIKIMKE